MRKSVLKSLRLMVFLYFFTMCVNPCLAFQFQKSQAKYDKFQIMQSLNYCSYALTKIVNYNDKVILTNEYDKIINNINLNAIVDEDLIQLLSGLMDTVTDELISEGRRNRIEKKYQKLMKRALVDEIMSVGNININPVSFATAAVTAVTAVGSAYVNYERRMEDYRDAWEEENASIEEDKLVYLNNVRKQMLQISWQLLKNYNLDDKYRLSEKQINEFFDSTKTDDAMVRYRKMTRLLGDHEAFSYFPPFWYHYAISIKEAFSEKECSEKENHPSALSCLNQYQEVYKNIFRKDPLLASVALERIQYHSNRRDILKDLDLLLDQSHNFDFQNYLFAGLKYLELGLLHEAEECFLRNIDNEKEVSLNKRMLADMLLDKNKSFEFHQIMDQILDDKRVENIDKLYLIGRCKDVNYLQKFRDEISSIELIAFDDAHFLESFHYSYLVTIPEKWVLHELPFEVEIISPNFKMNETFGSLEDENIKIQRKNQRICLVFENPGYHILPELTLDSDISVVIKHPLISMTLKYGIDDLKIYQVAPRVIVDLIPFVKGKIATYHLEEIEYRGEQYLLAKSGILHKE